MRTPKRREFKQIFRLLFRNVGDVIDRLNKSDHLLASQESSSIVNLADIHMKSVITRHGVQVFNFPDRETWFKFCL